MASNLGFTPTAVEDGRSDARVAGQYRKYSIASYPAFKDQVQSPVEEYRKP
jgi:hypothetical protein